MHDPDLARVLKEYPTPTLSKNFLAATAHTRVPRRVHANAEMLIFALLCCTVSIQFFSFIREHYSSMIELFFRVNIVFSLVLHLIVFISAFIRSYYWEIFICLLLITVMHVGEEAKKILGIRKLNS